MFDDEQHYANAAEEIAGGEVRQGLWTQALAETGYDEQLARARYLTLRAKALKAQAAAGLLRRGVYALVKVATVLGVLCGLAFLFLAINAQFATQPDYVSERPSRAPQRNEAPELDRLITQIERAYPALNPKSAYFDKGKTDQVVGRWEAYEREGYSRADALLKAVETEGFGPRLAQ